MDRLFAFCATAIESVECDKYDIEKDSLLYNRLKNPHLFAKLVTSSGDQDKILHLKEKYDSNHDKFMLTPPGLPFESIWFESCTVLPSGEAWPSCPEIILTLDENRGIIFVTTGFLVAEINSKGDLYALITGYADGEPSKCIIVERGIIYSKATVEYMSDEFRRFVHYSLMTTFNTPKITSKQKTNVKIRNTTNKNHWRKTTKIKEMILISDKKYARKKIVINGAPIKWSHSWEVMGHWRIAKGIGKGRDGNYDQLNRTWVLPHVKGEGDLVKKTRIKRTENG